MTDTDLHVLLPLQNLINQIVHSTPIGATDQLAAELTVRTAVWVGKNVLPRTDGLAPFVTAVDNERQAQLAKWGDQRHPDGTGSTLGFLGRTIDEYVTVLKTAADRHNAHDPAATPWALILLEEVCEALAESDPAKLRAELVQSAAVIAAWISDIDRRPAAERCDVEFVGGGRCAKLAGHRPPGSQDTHIPEAPKARPAP